MNPVIIILIVVVVVGAIATILVGMRRNMPNEDPLDARLAEFSQRGDVVSLEQIEMSQPFVERVIYPLIRRLGELSTRFTPQHVLETTAKRLELAGNPGRLEPATFLALRFVVAAVFGGVLGFLFAVSESMSRSQEYLILMLFIVLGFFFPQLWLKSRIDRRQKEIRKAMPDALDLLTICVEAGLGFDAAMAKVTEKWNNELSLAFARVIREIQLGKLRKEAMRDMADRVGIAEMTSFVAAVLQSETLGVSMAKVLRIQADQMRLKRRQRAEEEAHKAPVKMLIPMGVFIFPSILIILMTPAAFRIMEAFGSM